MVSGGTQASTTKFQITTLRALIANMVLAHTVSNILAVQTSTMSVKTFSEAESTDTTNFLRLTITNTQGQL